MHRERGPNFPKFQTLYLSGMSVDASSGFLATGCETFPVMSAISRGKGGKGLRKFPIYSRGKILKEGLPEYVNTRKNSSRFLLIHVE